MNDMVAFDPGFNNLMFDFNTFVNEVYSQLMSFSSIAQKRARFKLFNDRIFSGLENNIAFYNGCLLWAYYIKKQSGAKEIEGNPFLGLQKNQITETDVYMHINFLENYFDSYERDTLYYVGKKIEIPEQWKEIIGLYNEFLKLNEGLIKTKTVSDLILPEKLSKKSFRENIKLIIDEAIKKADLKLLLNIKI